MSISAALNSALSGLGAASRSAQVISSNISNALTDGYARREIDLATTQLGGVRVGGVSRISDPVILGARRIADAEAGFAQARSSAQASMTASLGEIGDANSLSGRVARFDAVLLEAASNPGSATRLEAVANAGRDLASFLNSATDDIQATRLRADQSINDQVSALKGGLGRIDELNAEIATAGLRGADTNALKDLRQREIDAIADIVPLRILPRANDAVAIISSGGQILLEDRPADIAFAPTTAISAGAVLGTPLSGLTIDGRAIAMTGTGSRMAGGTLQAAFDARDRSGPLAQAEIDAVASDLIARFEGLDPSLAPGAPGLFTDAGAALGVTPAPGIAGRIAINAAVDPALSGDFWKLRTGLAAGAPGPPGDATLLQSWRTALTDVQAAAAPELAGVPRSFAGHADTVMALSASRLSRAESDTAYTVAQASEIRRQELEQGVDTDDEIQKLLLVERIYGANTKVMQAADAMLQRLLEI